MKKKVYFNLKNWKNLDHLQIDIYKKPTSTDNAVCSMFDHCLELTFGITKYVAHTTQSVLYEWTNKN